MPFGLQWIVDKITFPSPPSSYSLTSHPELFFVKSPKSRPSYPGVPCMLYAIPQGAPVLLVHAHSNGCDIGDMRQTLQSISESLRVHVMSFEFPGYGLHVGSANMRSIDEAALAVLNFIVNDLRINLGQVVWYGRSIGSGPALRAVHKISQEMQKQPGGVVLQCGYANFPEVAGHLFGRVAKQLVSPLWPNEAMVRDLQCPVLLIHGRNDTMIPIEQSEKLWKAVSMKELSHFHTCDCGHNDFNFRRCTLRPIYDFLLGVISSPNFPATNFGIEIAASSRTFVHHIGPLRSKIPVYSFRRTELEEWMRRLQQRSASVQSERAASSSSGTGSTPLMPGRKVVVRGLQDMPEMNGKQGFLLELDQQERLWTVRLTSGENMMLGPDNLEAVPSPRRSSSRQPAEAAPDPGARRPGSASSSLSPGQPVVVVGSGKQGLLLEFDKSDAKWRVQLDGASEVELIEPEELRAAEEAPTAPEQGKMAATGREVRPAGAQQRSASPSPTPSKGSSGGKDKGRTEPPPIPDFTELPAIEDVSLALLDLEGMVRTCALRVDAFLERLQRQLDRIEGLESKPLDEVIDFVEAEFWACDPLLCLWEEVSLPQGERVRFRLGPFSVDSTGAGGYDRGLGAGAGSTPSVLRIPVWIFQPSPAHFRCLAEWSLLHSERLQRNLPATGLSKTGSGCCCVPSKGLGRTSNSGSSRKQKPRAGGRGAERAAHPTRGVLATSLAAHFVNWVDKTDEIKQVFSRFVTLHNNPDEAFKKLSSSSALGGPALGPKEIPSDMPKSPQQSVEEHDFDEEVVSPPCVAPAAADPPGSRAVAGNSDGCEELRASGPGPPRPPWAPPLFSAAARGLLREGAGPMASNLSELYAQMGSQEPGRSGEQRDDSLPNVYDFQAVSRLVNDPAGMATDKHTDWLTASLLLHYERLMCNSSHHGNEAAASDAGNEESWCDPMGPELRKTGLALNKAIKAFAHARLREHREQQNQRQRLKPTRLAQQPPDDGETEAAQPLAGNNAAPDNAGRSME
mmetsp:Transcript_74571/g.230471  ORF Transcript_74571/g.230471 Transcript_74571/m.230471 type:complete len:1020 (+) Transcript_74571:112-3171(+)